MIGVREMEGENQEGGGKGEAEMESQTSSIVTGEEKTQAFLVIASSAPLFEAQRDKRAAIYWSPHIMVLLFTFIHLASARVSSL